MKKILRKDIPNSIMGNPDIVYSDILRAFKEPSFEYLGVSVYTPNGYDTMIPISHYAFFDNTLFLRVELGISFKSLKQATKINFKEIDFRFQKISLSKLTSMASLASLNLAPSTKVLIAVQKNFSHLGSHAILKPSCIQLGTYVGTKNKDECYTFGNWDLVANYTQKNK